MLFSKYIAVTYNKAKSFSKKAEFTSGLISDDIHVEREKSRIKRKRRFSTDSNSEENLSQKTRSKHVKLNTFRSLDNTISLTMQQPTNMQAKMLGKDCSKNLSKGKLTI